MNFLEYEDTLYESDLGTTNLVGTISSEFLNEVAYFDTNLVVAKFVLGVIGMCSSSSLFLIPVRFNHFLLNVSQFVPVS